MLRVGLTGGIGSGKSSVSRLLAERGAVIIDADLLAREVVAPGTPGLAEIVTSFGPGILTNSGELDRATLGASVFMSLTNSQDARSRLESIIHPRVRQRAHEIEAGAGDAAIVVHDIPLLVETGQARDFDVVVVVDAPPDAPVRRLVDLRGMSADQAQARIDAQATRAERRAVASYVIDNDATLSDLATAVDALWTELRERH